MIKRQFMLGVAVIPLLTLPATISIPTASWAAIDEIIVTTRKRAENLQSLPIAVTAISGTQLQRNGIADLNDISKFSPSIQFDSSFGPADTRVTIRGLSNTRGRSNVAFLVDGVDVTTENINAAGSGLLANQRLLADVERVELVKGPQSALYGRAAFAGAISYITKEPGDEMEGNAAFDIGQDGIMEVSGAIGGPVIDDRLGVRITGVYWEEDGHYNNVASGEDLGGGDGFGIAATTVYTPTDRLKIKSRLSYSDDQYDPPPTTHMQEDGFVLFPSNAVAAGIGTSSPPVFNGIADNGNIGFPILTNFGGASGLSAAHSEDPLTGQDYTGTALETFRATLNASYAFDWGTFTSITGWTDADQFSEYDQDYQAVGRPDRLLGHQQARFTTTTRQFSQELRFSSDWEGPLQVTLGSYYWEEERDAVDENYIVACLDLDLSTPNPNDRISGICDGSANTLFGTTGTVVDSWQDYARQLSPLPKTPFSADTYHWSWYGMVEWDITDSLKFTVEDRYVDEDFYLELANFSPCGIIGFQFAPLWDEATTTSGGQPFDALCTIDNLSLAPDDPFNPRPILVNGTEDSKFHTPKITLEWSPNDDSLVFFSIAKAQKPGGMTTLNGGSSPVSIDDIRFDPEKMVAYELGVKTNWETSLGFFQINSSVFFQDYSDKQVSTQVIVNDQLQPRVLNASGAEVWGVEIDTVWQPNIEGLTLTAAYTWLDATYTAFLDRTRSLVRAGAAGGCPLVYLNGDSSISINNQADADAIEMLASFDDDFYFCELDLSGNQLERTPEHSFTASISYERPLGNTGFDWFVEANTLYQDERFLTNDNITALDDYWSTDIRLGLENSTFDLLLYVENLFDDDTIKTGGVGPEFAQQVRELGFTGGLGVNHNFAQLPTPRIIGLRGNFRF